MDTDVTIALVIAAWIAILTSSAWALRARRRQRRRATTGSRQGLEP